jgi:hypothetical protein
VEVLPCRYSFTDTEVAFLGLATQAW